MPRRRRRATTGLLRSWLRRSSAVVRRPSGSAQRWRRKPGCPADHDCLVELDGVVGHEAVVDSWSDLERDLLAAASGRMTLRAGWRQVLNPCRLASVVAVVLSSRGWTDVLRACGPGCSAVSATDVGGRSA